MLLSSLKIKILRSSSKLTLQIIKNYNNTIRHSCKNRRKTRYDTTTKIIAAVTFTTKMPLKT